MNSTNTTDLLNQIAAMQAQLSAVSTGINVCWTLISAGFIFLMQAGFLLAELGALQKRNVNNVVVKNFISGSMSALAFYLVGFGFGFGDVNGGFIGHTSFVGIGFAENSFFPLWCFQYAFAGVTTIIFSGAIAERAKTETFLIFSPFFTGIVYSVVVAWTWGGGWLNQMGYIDFAGSSVVHFTGAIASLVGSLVIGPRLGKIQGQLPQKKPNNTVRVVVEPNSPQSNSKLTERNQDLNEKKEGTIFYENEDRVDAGSRRPTGTQFINKKKIEQLETQKDYSFRKWTDFSKVDFEDPECLEVIHKIVKNQIVVNYGTRDIGSHALGVYLLWFGWFLFNAGSTLALADTTNSSIAGRAFMNSIIGPAAGGITCLLLKKWLNRKAVPDTPFESLAVLNGVLAGLVGITANCYMIENWASIFIGSTSAIIYCLASRVLSKIKRLDDPLEAFAIHGPCGFWGILMTSFFHMQKGVIYGYSGRQIGIQLLGLVCIAAWVGSLSLIGFLTIRYARLLRVDKADEILGLDIVYHIPIDGIEKSRLKNYINTLYEFKDEKKII